MPMTQAELALAARDEAVERVGANAAPDAIEAARGMILELPRGTEFTTDDLGDPGFAEPRAWGAVMHGLAAEGAIAATPGYRCSNRPVCHRRPKRVWRRL